MIWLAGPPLVLGWRTKCLFWLFACCSAPSDQAAMTGKTYQRLFISEDEFLKLETVIFTFLVDVYSYWLGEIKFAKMKLFNRKTWTNIHGALEVQISHLALRKNICYSSAGSGLATFPMFKKYEIKKRFFNKRKHSVYIIHTIKDEFYLNDIQLIFKRKLIETFVYWRSSCAVFNSRWRFLK